MKQCPYCGNDLDRLPYVQEGEYVLVNNHTGSAETNTWRMVDGPNISIYCPWCESEFTEEDLKGLGIL